MPKEGTVKVIRELTSRGYNAERAAVTLLANATDPEAAVDKAVEEAPAEAFTVTVDHARAVLKGAAAGAPAAAENRAETSAEEMTTQEANPESDTASPGDTAAESSLNTDSQAIDQATQSTVSGGADTDAKNHTESEYRGETKGSSNGGGSSRSPTQPTISGDITGHSTGTGTYEEFVAVFRDRYERLADRLRRRVTHRPTNALESMAGGDAGLIGMVNDVRSTAGGHWLVELEDTNGVFPTLVLQDREIADIVDELLLDEVIGVEGSLSDDGEILFVDDIYFPDVPRSHSPTTAERHVQAALISDIHVGSEEFVGAAWDRFTDWLHTPEAEPVEYLLIAGDMVEGVGVYPDQDEELEIIDVFEQYEYFSEQLKAVPGDIEIVMIPGNHDAVRLAEPQPGFDQELREVMSAHDAQIVGNPATVTVEGVEILMYHGVSLDEVVAELPDASYEAPTEAMAHLLRKRHLAPTYGGKNRIAPESRDYLVIDDVPDVFHCGHVHTLGIGEYHGVRTINSGCWQSQTPFQRSVNIDPDTGYAPILDLDTLDVTVRKFH